MGDGLKRVFATIKHGQARALDPLTAPQREVLALAVGGRFIARFRQTAESLERRGLITIHRAKDPSAKWMVSITPAGQAVHDALQASGNPR